MFNILGLINHYFLDKINFSFFSSSYKIDVSYQCNQIFYLIENKITTILNLDI